MKKKKILYLIIIVLIIAVPVSSYLFYSVLHDESRLSVLEKEWISNNKNNVISINVINDINVFGKDGKGVYLDFLDSLSEKYLLEINPVTFNSDEKVDGVSLTYTTNNDVESLYEDEFVVVNKANDKILSFNNLNSTKIAINKEYKDYLKAFVNFNDTVEIIEEDNKENLLKDFKENEEIKYIIVPKLMYLDEILKNDYHIVYHISDAKIHVGVTKDDSELSSIISKYFKSYKKKSFDESFNKNELEAFIKNLNISSTDIDKIKSGTYKYGFINNDPYELISGGTFGGINAVYLKKFSDLIDVKIDFVKYNKIEKFEKAIEDGKINIYYDYYNVNNSGNINSNLVINYNVIARRDNNIVINSLNSLKNNEVYVEENTKVYDYLKNNTSIDIKTYKNKKELKKIIKKDVIIIIDSNKYESFKSDILEDFSVRYTNNIGVDYKFVTNLGDTFNNLFNRYLETIDNNEMKYIGLNNYFVTKKSGILFGTLAKYILVLILILFVILVIIYRKTKKIKIARKIKKEDKMRFIDQLTSLKNRNYLTENLENWNNNTIYPQAVIVLDLNKLQDINDTLGYEKGDEQIQAVANILIKTQLDNTDIIRTDGNEFLIYLVGYETKQITSYIHKLNREFKKLPFDYGVAVGYSMITDDVKSIEDATNEAVEQVKEQKEEKKDE